MTKSLLFRAWKQELIVDPGNLPQRELLRMIELQNISYAYGTQDILQDVNLELPEHGFTVLAGPNGAGKSTLLYLLMAYLKPKTGSIRLRGRELHKYSRSELARIIAFIPQELHSEFDYTVLETVLMGRFPYLGIMQNYGEEDKELALGALEQMNLLDLKDRFVSELSGGEKQRVYLVRALVQNTRFIFLDESLSQLDINYQLEIMRLLKSISQTQDKAILLISHNLNLAANYADRMLFIKNGKLLYAGSPNQAMQSSHLDELFGIKLTVARNPISGVNNIVYP
ncbi:MAG: ABC transporter ATP-binding protein [Candidatus Cloacimonetes bacterium]|nr:ABC transporter ATP-binding protein [Candidatus Cloacimonadota bacterium]